MNPNKPKTSRPAIILLFVSSAGSVVAFAYLSQTIKLNWPPEPGVILYYIAYILTIFIAAFCTAMSIRRSNGRKCGMNYIVISILITALPSIGVLTMFVLSKIANLLNSLP